MSTVRATEQPLLEVRDLRTYYPVVRRAWFGKQRWLKAVDGVSLSVGHGEIVGLAGESGCGKSSLGRTIARLVPPSSGSVVLDGVELTALEGRKLRQVRSRVQMVFQDPYASLNPRMTARAVLTEALDAGGHGVHGELEQRSAALLDSVGLGRVVLDYYPHQLSGGQRQRLAIARALAVEPRLIVADEPVSALDVSVSAQIVSLFQSLRRERGVAFLLIAHDLALLRNVCDRIAIMYLGRLVEVGPARDLVDCPKHPYTQALISAIPLPDPVRERARRRIMLEGDPPSPVSAPAGCSFHPRCARRELEVCAVEPPALQERAAGWKVACHCLASPNG